MHESRGLRLLSAALLLALAVRPVLAQHAGSARDPGSREPTVLTGRVVGGDGLPVARAVVATSAGGRAVTGEAGDFQLAVGLPVEAERVRVTAVWESGRGRLAGSTDVAGLVRFGVTPVGTIALAADSACRPEWLPTFGGLKGVDDTIYALAVHDDGTAGGPALYLGGQFSLAGGLAASAIARWDGTAWSALGGGLDGTVLALASHDDGSGPALYAGGEFTTADGTVVNHIARWDGSRWSALGAGLKFPVRALAVFEDGGPGGPVLIAGGGSLSPAGPPVRVLAKWDGAQWTPFGGAVNGAVLALAVVDGVGGAGPALYAGGTFTVANGAVVNHVMRRRADTHWMALGTGTNGPVHAIAAFDDGSGGGPALYVGGNFASAGGASATNVAKWSGSSWSALGDGMRNGVRALSAWDDGTGAGSALYAAGTVTSPYIVAAPQVAKWDGAVWTPVGSDLYGDVFALQGFPLSADERALFAGGDLGAADGHHVDGLIAWDGSAWTAPPGKGINGSAVVLEVFDDGQAGGSALFMGGGYTKADDIVTNKIGKWDGAEWFSLDGGVEGIGDTVRSLAVFDDGLGGGPALYAGGILKAAGGVPMNRIAKWDGTSWWPVGAGFTSAVEALEVYDDGGGPALYAGGTASHISKWDGSSWTTVPGSSPGAVNHMIVFDAGSGPALFVARSVTVYSWNGTTWSSLPYMNNGEVNELAVFDDRSGAGPALYACGNFTLAGGVPASRIAKWDGSSWAPLGSGMNGRVTSLGVFDDGCGAGPALYAGGDFTSAGGMAANRIAKWDGKTWSPLGSGVDHTVFELRPVAVPGADGEALVAAGYFSVATDSGDAFMAVWGRPATSQAWTDLGLARRGSSGAPLLSGRGSLRPGTPGSLTLVRAAPLALAQLVCSASAASSPFACGRLLSGPLVLALPLQSSPAGETVLAWDGWPAGLSGTRLHFQCVVRDPGAECGIALSNALRAEVP
ncbi:MAG TPA: hypothetical protein VFD43_13425 [Planctomycetota bacterium]|nr:hypothetical protein [Planctomycetota bacterium]